MDARGRHFRERFLHASRGETHAAAGVANHEDLEPEPAGIQGGRAHAVVSGQPAEENLPGSKPGEIVAQAGVGHMIRSRKRAPRGIQPRRKPFRRTSSILPTSRRGRAPRPVSPGRNAWSLRNTSRSVAPTARDFHIHQEQEHEQQAEDEANPIFVARMVEKTLG